MAFTIEPNKSGDNLVINLKGNIDEDANFQAVDASGCATIVLDLDSVAAINSVGIREWIKWVKALPTTAKLVVRKCPKIIVDQINMVSGFLPPGTIVESFYVPYFADDSGEEKMVLFNNGKEFRGGDVFPPADVKDSSGADMEMDVIETKYFKFLKNG